jgi:hypothetical protein
MVHQNIAAVPEQNAREQMNESGSIPTLDE